MKRTMLLCLGLATHAAGEAASQQASDIYMSCDFDNDDWWKSWNMGGAPSAKYLTLVDGKDACGGKGKSLKILIPKGDLIGCSFHYFFKKNNQPDPEEVYFRYYLKFDENFAKRVDGGKLFGFAGTYGHHAGSGGSPVDGSNGWTARGG